MALSPAFTAFSNQADYGATNLVQQREEERKRRIEAARQAGYSSAGAALSGYGLMGAA